MVTASMNAARHRELVDRDRMDYVQLAYALLDSGDSPRSIVAFLQTDYGLAEDQARAAIILARPAPEESDTGPHCR
jgi:hypothetical protein